MPVYVASNKIQMQIAGLSKRLLYTTSQFRGRGGRFGRKQHKTPQQQDAPSGERNGVDLGFWVGFIKHSDMRRVA